MKPVHIIAIALAFTVLPPALLAETPYEHDLKLLKEQRDRAVATAVEPINRRYKESLEQLLKRATQGNDLDTALKVKTELGTAPAVPAAPKPDAPPGKPNAPALGAAALTDLKLQIAGTKWKFLADGHLLEFRPGGTCVEFGVKIGKYEAKSKDKVEKIYGGQKKPDILFLTRDGRHLEKNKGFPTYELKTDN